MTAEEHAQSLEELAAALGVTRGYHDGTGQWRRACDEALLATLRVLGAPVERIEDATDVLRDRRASGDGLAAGAPRIVCMTAGVEQAVALEGPPPHRCALVHESGERLELPVSDEGSGHPGVRVPQGTAAGYHHLEFEQHGRIHEVALFVAPPRLPVAAKGWGLFAPLYGIRRDAQDFASYGDLARLGKWMTSGIAPSDRDAAYLGTLPLLAGFFEDPFFEPSPYSPLSRAFWSELYVDPAASPEFAASDDAARVATGREARAHGGSQGLIDYRGAMRVRRAGIEALLGNLDRVGGRRRQSFEDALAGDDELARYASFRAAVEQHGCLWQQWPDRARSGQLRAGVDYDGSVFRYHAYAQWLAREQIADAAKVSDAGLYLDLPLGCHGGGYDTWRHRDDFAAGTSAGAPPDNVFEGGQNWAFPPLHPANARQSRYASLRAALRHHFAHAALLRVDHVMGLHRLFWIPNGFTAADGVYVNSNARELWSILAIEASRARGGRGAAVVGEDLGTVPDEVRVEMNSRGAMRLHVIPFELRASNSDNTIAAPPRDALTCLGTHDMEPFATWWEAPGTNREALSSFLRCAADAASALPSLLAWMAGSDATVACANLEDLWLERERQNLPGTASDHGNWQRPFMRTFDDFTSDKTVRRLLDLVRGAGQAAATEASR